MRSSIALLLFALLSVGSVAVSADDNGAIKKIMIANYAMFSKAFETKDAAGISALLSDDYTAETSAGQPPTSRAQVIADMKQQMSGMSEVKWVRTIHKLDVDGKSAVVIVEGHLTGKVPGRDGKSHSMELNATSEDTWVKLTGEWKLKHSKVLKFHMTMDGKEMATH